MSNQRSIQLLLFALLIVCAPLAAAMHAASGQQEVPPPPPAITIEMLDNMTRLPGDLAPLPPVPVPADNAQTEAKIALGKSFFFDTRLSGNRTFSCASCHNLEKGLADGYARARGFAGRELGRHTPTIWNAAYNFPQFWDGRATGLEEQAAGPIFSPVEMNMESEAKLIERLEQVSQYREQFRAIFGEAITLKNIRKAIAAFERTLVTPDTRFDRYARGDKQALNEVEKRGLILFIGKASCSQCHNGPNFTDSKFHNLIVPQQGPSAEDLGRYNVTKNDGDRYCFKTPTLRNITLTAPYMHDGAFNSLREVIDFYDQGCGMGDNKSSLIFPLNLSEQEKADLTAFLQTLTGKLPEIHAPQLPPE